MPSALNVIPHYVPAPPTQESCESLRTSTCQDATSVTAVVDYANLAIIDLEKCATSEGRAQVARQVRDAMSTVGFFYAINHGYTQAQVHSYPNNWPSVSSLTPRL